MPQPHRTIRCNRPLLLVNSLLLISSSELCGTVLLLGPTEPCPSVYELSWSDDDIFWNIPSGDDDTLFFIPNVLKMLEKLDHTIPMALTDNLWHKVDESFGASR